MLLSKKWQDSGIQITGDPNKSGVLQDMSQSLDSHPLPW